MSEDVSQPNPDDIRDAQKSSLRSKINNTVMALDRSQVIKVYTNRLVHSLVPYEFGEEFIQSIVRELLNHFLNVNQKSSTVELKLVLNQCKRIFLNSNKNSEWIKFLNVINSLMNYKSQDQIKQYLIFLTCLKGVKLDSNILQPSRTFQEVQSSPYGPSSGGNNWFDIRQGSQLSGTEKNDGSMDQLILQHYDTLPESSILPYLSYTLLGVDSKLFQFKDIDEVISIEIPDNINNCYSSLLGKILEPALIYVKLKKFLSTSRNELDSPIKKAFINVLQNRLNEYVNFINEIFYDATSLMTINQKLYRPTLQLRLLYILTDHLNLSGYEFLIKVYELSKFGDLQIQDIANLVFVVVSVPYYEIIENWISKGDLIDTNKDFFIEFDQEANHINDIIKYIPEKVPDFFVQINKDIGFKIFQIGKILIFLNKYCKELQWVNEYIVKYSDIIYQQHQGLRSMNRNFIKSLINLQYNELLQFLNYIVFEKYELLSHLNNFKNFYLMNSNDFIEAIILKGFELFNEPSNQLTSTQLSGILFDAVNFSSVRNFDAAFKNRLDARILDLTHGTIGWQVFTIEYKIDDLPITAITNYNKLNLQYLRFFNFLWKLKQINYLLDINFIESNNLKRNELHEFFARYRTLKFRSRNLKDNKIIWIVKSFNLTNLIRQQLVNFLNNLVYYISFDLIESNYNQVVKEFQKEDNDKLKIKESFLPLIPISNTNDLLNFDEIISINNNYCKKFKFKLIDETVIGKSGKSFITLVYSILETIFKFIKSNEEFNNLIINYISLLNIDENIDMSDIENDLNYVETNSKRLITTIKDLKRDYESLLHEFIHNLKNDLDLKDLAKAF